MEIQEFLCLYMIFTYIFSIFYCSMYIQIKYRRIDEITSIATSTGNTGVLPADYTDFGRLCAFIPLQIDITPKFSDSLIKINFSIYGEATNHNCGFLIGEYNSTENLFQIIRRAGYEGYNSQ